MQTTAIAVVMVADEGVAMYTVTIMLVLSFAKTQEVMLRVAGSFEWQLR